MMETRSVCFCGYSVGTDVYSLVPEFCRPFGSRVLLIGGERAMAAALPGLEAALLDSGLSIVEARPFGGDCTQANIDRLAGRARELEVDMIFGAGGGKALDTAKGAAFAAGLPVFTFPTIAATCAGTTALSVVYREDGSFDRFAFYPRPARHCFINLDILAHAPWQYLQAGMGDTIGKFFECHFAARGDKLAHSSARWSRRRWPSSSARGWCPCWCWTSTTALSLTRCTMDWSCCPASRRSTCTAMWWPTAFWFSWRWTGTGTGLGS